MMNIVGKLVYHRQLSSMLFFINITKKKKKIEHISLKLSLLFYNLNKKCIALQLSNIRFQAANPIQPEN